MIILPSLFSLFISLYGSSNFMVIKRRVMRCQQYDAQRRRGHSWPEVSRGGNANTSPPYTNSFIFMRNLRFAYLIMWRLTVKSKTSYTIYTVEINSTGRLFLIATTALFSNCFSKLAIAFHITKLISTLVNKELYTLQQSLYPSAIYKANTQLIKIVQNRSLKGEYYFLKIVSCIVYHTIAFLSLFDCLIMLQRAM